MAMAMASASSSDLSQSSDRIRAASDEMAQPTNDSADEWPSRRMAQPAHASADFNEQLERLVAVVRRCELAEGVHHVAVR
jgi:hypothetical protein